MATTLLVPGTVLLLPCLATAGRDADAIGILIGATALLVVAALIDASTAWRSGARLVGPACMLVGGHCFLGGALLYWPSYAAPRVAALGAGWSVARVGTWVFRAGTTAYLVGSYTSLRVMMPNLGRKRTDGERLGFAGVVSYTVGAVLYFVGGGLSEAGAAA